ncbi:MAG: 2OG-Fe(II) oxygenase [Myxococcota bacterium]
MGARTLDAPSFFLDGPALADRGRASRASYAAASPHPHAVVDGLFGDDVARALAQSFPGPGAARWKLLDYPQQRRLGHLQRHGFADVPAVLRHALHELNGQAFLDFLEALTGVEGLIGDPHFKGAGLHLTPPGGFLEVHADFDRDGRRALKRVLTAVYFLTPDWDEAWGGHLELWSHDASRCEVRIAPRLDRLVVMAQGDTHWHGHPTPLACPEGRFRASLAAYFYVVSPRPDVPAHGALWRPR